jgi:lysyl-tRNA synthetase class II
LENKKRREIEMKKIAATVIALTFVFTVASLSFAANEFQIKGIVTKISGNQITIKDDKGKEMTVEGSVGDIKVGDLILLRGEIFKAEATRTELTTKDIEFLTKQCLIDQADVNVIPQLGERTRMKLFSLIDKRDCKLLVPFKATRNFYRQLQYNKPIPLAPAGWSILYLTDKEFKRYTDILEKAPW